MSRLLLVMVIFIAIYLLLKYYRRPIHKKDVFGEEASKRGENMVCCEYCGVHLPKSESVILDYKHYCSEAHHRSHTDKSE